MRNIDIFCLCITLYYVLSVKCSRTWRPRGHPGNAVSSLERLQRVLDQQRQERVFDAAGEANHPRILANKSKKKEEKITGGAKPKIVKNKSRKKKEKADVDQPDQPDQSVHLQPRVRGTEDSEWQPRVPLKQGITSDRQLRSRKVTFSDKNMSSPSHPHIIPSERNSSPPSPPPPIQTLESESVNPAIVSKDSLHKLNSDLGRLSLRKKIPKEVWVVGKKQPDKKLLAITHNKS